MISEEWFSAHAIFFFAYREKGSRKPILPKSPRARIRVMENIYLIRARPGRDAVEKSEQIVKAEVIFDPTSTLNGRPCRFVYAGIRKIIRVCPPLKGLGAKACAALHGTEVTYSDFEVRGMKAVRELVAGRPVQLRYDP